MNRIYKMISLLGIAFSYGSAIESTAVLAYSDEPHAFVLGGDHDHDDDHDAAPFTTQGIGWTRTASGTSRLGAPAILTWSVAPDGTTLPGNFIKASGSSNGVNTPSDLVSFLDGVHHNGASPGGSDLTQRTWWGLMNDAFQRWDAVSGVSFIYEPNDDGARIGTRSGVLGTRGDHRIGGHSLDGQTSPTILGFNYFPNNADMVIDTDEVNRWSNSTNNYRLFRNMIMHEVGHGLGLAHVESVDVDPNRAKFQFGTFLMEPTLASGFDGPQFDDILGIHRLYGDANEEGAGNDQYFNATTLGTVLTGQTISIGTDADDLRVTLDDVDFVSIDDTTDTDYFRFTITTPQAIDLLLTPMGPTYDEGRQGSGDAGTQQPFVSSAEVDLSLTLFDSSGTVALQTTAENGIGLSESISDYELMSAGDYYVRVSGVGNAAQFFQLDISAVPEPASLGLALLGLTLWGAGRRR